VRLRGAGAGPNATTHRVRIVAHARRMLEQLGEAASAGADERLRTYLAQLRPTVAAITSEAERELAAARHVLRAIDAALAEPPPPRGEGR
jgi:hypothetical protein